MFKRYKNPFEKENAGTLLEGDSGGSHTQELNQPMASHEQHQSTYSQNQASPHVFESKSDHGTSPYTPSSTYISSQGQARERSLPPAHDTENDTTIARYPMTEPVLQSEEPDTTLGEGVVFKGELTFQRLLRIDGQFEGELVSEGKLIIGTSGAVKSNITMREAIIEGKVEGNIVVADRLELRNRAEVYGNIEAGILSVDEGVTIIGNVTVRPTDEG